MYEKDGSLQKGREIVRCSFSTALSALTECLNTNQRSNAWQSMRCDEFEYYRIETPKTVSRPVAPPMYEATVTILIFQKVEELEFSVRPANCLKNDNIVLIGDLTQKTEAALLRVPNLGRKLLNEIKEVLTQKGLHLGMEIPGWPPSGLGGLSAG
jgi:DNA-directed RNA polymerase alpha subunit